MQLLKSTTRNKMRYESLIKPPVSSVLKSGRVVLAPSESVGEHVTVQREELIIVLKGKAKITESIAPLQIESGAENGIFEVVGIYPREIFLEAGGVHFIKEGILHDVINVGEGDLEYVYVVGLLNGKE